MIKLITCDIDGTLIKDYSHNLSEQIFSLIKKFNEKNVLFVATSGRQLHNLKKLFSPVKNEIGYISENGALISYNNKIIHKSIMENDNAVKLANMVLSQDSLELLISGESTAYIIPKCKDFLNHIQNEVKNDITIVNSLEEIKEQILKLAIYHKNGITEEIMLPFKNEFGTIFQNTLSGHAWYDFMNLNTHKGNSIKILQQLLNIKKEETVAFGDNFNDIEMLSDAKYSFVMENAPEEVKKYGKFTCKRVEDSLEELYNKFFQ